MVPGTEPRKLSYVHDIRTLQILDFHIGLSENRENIVVDSHDPTPCAKSTISDQDVFQLNFSSHFLGLTTYVLIDTEQKQKKIQAIHSF